MFLPRVITTVKSPPLKCQGIKTKIVPFIARSIRWDAGSGRWIEPFLGSGAVAFNIMPPRAYLADTNPHIINFYKGLQNGSLSADIIADGLMEMGQKLKSIGEEYYYEIREQFNTCGGSLLFIFLNRSCYNGVIRFNSRGEFNVPFCRNVNRFTRRYVDKIRKQIEWVCKVIGNSDWVFDVKDWRDTLKTANKEDFVYCDPPYIGRHVDYYNSWTEDDANELACAMFKLPCGFATSMWHSDGNRINAHLSKWSRGAIVTTSHFYRVGPTEWQRHNIKEALIISTDNVAINERQA